MDPASRENPRPPPPIISNTCRTLRHPGPADALLIAAFKPQIARRRTTPTQRVNRAVSLAFPSSTECESPPHPSTTYTRLHIGVLGGLVKAFKSPANRASRVASVNFKLNRPPADYEYYDAGPAPIIGSLPTYDTPSPLQLTMDGVDFSTLGKTQEPFEPDLEQWKQFAAMVGQLGREFQAGLGDKIEVPEARERQSLITQGLQKLA